MDGKDGRKVTLLMVVVVPKVGGLVICEFWGLHNGDVDN